MPTVSVHLPEDLKDDLDAMLEYGDSRSAFVQEAVRRELERRQNEENPAQATLEDENAGE